MPSAFKDPSADCALCPRLAAFRADNRAKFPDWYNAPVPSFGSLDAQVLIVGLAPGLRGANRTSRPFTGDYAGDLLYPTLGKFGWTQGVYGAAPDDGLTMTGCRITNAVRCVPPENKPTGPECKACRQFLIDEIGAMKNLRVILALGGVSHGNILSALGERKKDFPFGHGNRHTLSNGLWLVDSYHCSRYNTNTGRLTTQMFHDVFDAVAELLSA
ncbi:MAG: uracil-DNA glycosylase [Rhodospirillales bacterium]